MKDKEKPVIEWGNFSNAELGTIKALSRNLFLTTAKSMEHGKSIRLDAMMYALAGFIANVFHANASQSGEKTVEPMLCALAALTCDALAHMKHDTGGFGRVVEDYITLGKTTIPTQQQKGGAE